MPRTGCNPGAAQIVGISADRRVIAKSREFADLRQEVAMSKLNTEERKELPASKFAEPEKRAYPIEDKAHARNAKARASQAVKAGRMSKAEEGKIDKAADKVLNKG